jgi:hypothetical protein
MWTKQQWYDDAFREAQASRSRIVGMTALWLGTLTKAMPGVPKEEILRRVAAFSEQRLAAAPDPFKYPETRGLRDLLLSGQAGRVAGAELNPEQAILDAGANVFYHKMLMSGRYQRETAQCSYVYFGDSDHGPLLANNLDSSPNEPFLPPTWPMLNENLIFGTVSSGVFGDEESPELFPVPVPKLVARYARTTMEAVEILQRYKDFWGPCNALLVDREHRLAMIEKTSCRIAVRYAYGYGYITAMAQGDAGMKAYIAERRTASLAARNLSPFDNDDIVYWAAQDQRHLLMRELLDQNRANPTLSGLQRLMQFRSPDRGNVAGNGEAIRFGRPGTAHFEHTLKTSIWLLGKGQAKWWAREAATGKPSWECPQPDVTFPGVLAWP